MFYNWCKGTTIILKIARNPTFFMCFCKEKVVFRAHFHFSSRLKVEFRLAIFNLSTYFFLLSTIQDFHFLVDTVSLFADPDFDIFLKHTL